MPSDAEKKEQARTPRTTHILTRGGTLWPPAWGSQRTRPGWYPTAIAAWRPSQSVLRLEQGPQLDMRTPLGEGGWALGGEGGLKTQES